MTRLLPLALLALLIAPALTSSAQAPAPASEAPADPAAFLARAVSLHQKGDVEGAVALYERVLALGADSPVLRSNLGAAYAGLGRYEDAVEQYGRAPDGSRQFSLGAGYVPLGRTEEALPLLERVAGRLQSEGENRFFSGVRDARGRLLGKTSAAGTRVSPAKP
jgi:tetratricopeptide (TPR) repeat protein